MNTLQNFGSVALEIFIYFRFITVRLWHLIWFSLTHLGASKLEVGAPQIVDQIGNDPDPHWTSDSLVSELNSFENKLNPQYGGFVKRKAAGASLRVTDDKIGIDPDPYWTSDSLLSELNSLENKLNSQSGGFVKRKATGASLRVPFVMRVSDDEISDTEDESDDREDNVEVGKDQTWSLVVAKRFNCDDIYLSESDGSDNESVLDAPYLMDGGGVVESSLFELSQEHQLAVKADIRSKMMELEMELIREHEKSDLAFRQLEKYRDARRESEKKFDAQYQRIIAEALDNHLTSIRGDHEWKSQVEEERIRSDAHEEKKRKEKAFKEERLCQERAKAEEEAKCKAEEAKSAALDADRKAAKEAADREVAEASEKQAAAVSELDVSGQLESEAISSHGTNQAQLAGSIVRSAESALRLEEERLKRLKVVEELNQSLKSSSNMGISEKISKHERRVGVITRQIRAIEDNVRRKASALVNIYNDSSYPKSVNLAALATIAKKVVNQHAVGDGVVYACAYVIVLVTSEDPHLIDLLLAMFHRNCMYTVPKHIAYSQTAFESLEAYKKAIGYEEKNGKIESTEDYLSRLECYMRLYGALVQTQVVMGVQNTHGPKEGWAWLARFLNNVPANIYTAIALYGFLSTAGFGLYKKYGSQFEKMLRIISSDFLEELKEQKDSELKKVISQIHAYIQDKMFLNEPEGLTLENELLSRNCTRWYD